MSPSAWSEANQHYLMGLLGEVRTALQRHADITPSGQDATHTSLEELAAALPAPSAFDTLCAIFGLSAFERQVLLLCAGVELDAMFAPLCAAAQGDAQRNYPTFSLALAALPAAHWSALSPEAPLRWWQFIQVEPSRALTRSPLRIDERILHYLVGISHLDTRLDGIARPLTPPSELTPSQTALAEQVATMWSKVPREHALPAVHLCGAQPETRRAVATATAGMLGLNAYVISAVSLPTLPGELEQLRRIWDREALLGNDVLLLECDEGESQEPGRGTALTHWLEAGRELLVVSSRERRALRGRAILAFDVPSPSTLEQKHLWKSVVGAEAGRLNGHLDRLVSQFELPASGMRAVWTKVRGNLAANDGGEQASTDAVACELWDACRIQSRPQLDDLAQRLKPVAVWQDLVLPEHQIETLREIAMHVRQRARVYETWGFVTKQDRGLGISVLFAGQSGTGKTMAAEVLAQELRLDIYRIDLSAAVSKYIGETEKNLRRIFDAAETSGAVLLFDEADALFGKRSEVKDSHDRYANIEVSYLLQRMESYRGLAILTTNQKEALDPAFLRRIRFVVNFPFPNAAQRAEIWRRIFPAAMPSKGLDVDKLARLNIPGGNIRNIALHAAFLAAEADEPVRMTHLLRAARREYEKMERNLTNTETQEWV